MKPRGFFITGTDTDAGKTMVTASIVRLMRKKGVDAVPMKPVQTGGGYTEEGYPMSPDLEHCLRASAYIPEDDEFNLMVPVCLKTPCSPHLALEIEKKHFDSSVVLEAAEKLAHRHELVIAEGAGGVSVPLSDTMRTVSLIKEMGYPAVVVIRNALGCVNHALNTIDVLKANDVEIACGIMTETEMPGNDDLLLMKDNPRIIEKMSGVGITGSLRFIPGLQPTQEDFWKEADIHMETAVDDLIERYFLK